VLRRIVEQDRLANARLSREPELRALTQTCACECKVQLASLPVTPHQHEAILAPDTSFWRTRWPPEAVSGAGTYGAGVINPREVTVSTTDQAVEVDGDKLMQFVFRAVDEVGATLNAALVVMGDKLGLYRAPATNGGLSPAELAERTGAAERYVREWLNAQAAGGYVSYDPNSGRYALPRSRPLRSPTPIVPHTFPASFRSRWAR
jgi:hypothetical protein